MKDGNSFDYKFDDFFVLESGRVLIKGDQEVGIQRKTFSLLLLFLKRPGEWIDSSEIISEVWQGEFVEDANLAVQIRNLRRVVGNGAIESKHKAYKFLPAVETCNERRVSGGLVFVDDFSSGIIDPARWIIKGKSVRVENKTAVLNIEETDNGGALWSSYFSFDPKRPISIVSRLKINPARTMNKYYFGGEFFLIPKVFQFEEPGLIDFDWLKRATLGFGVFYAKYEYESSEEIPVEGFFIVKPGGRPAQKYSHRAGTISQAIEPVWSEWFEQEIVYDPVTGLLDFFVDKKIVGKRDKIRTIPMPSWCKTVIDAWTYTAHIENGFIFRQVNKGGNVVGESLTPKAIYKVVKLYSEKLEKDGIAPHDLRRTFAKLAHKGGSPIDQIQLSLGHDSIKTTEKYLGVEQDLTDAPCDHLGIKIQ